MKKRIFLAAICLVFMSLSLAQATPLPSYLISAEAGRTTNGGEFLVSGNGMSFETLCLETAEFINNLPATYYGSIDNVVYYSSGSMASAPALADNTKRLYSYFLDHDATLTAADEGLIQIAIWAYQNQPADSPYYSGTSDPSLATNTYYLNASSYPLTHNVQVLNLFTDPNVTPGANTEAYEDRAQSLLISVPVPEPGILILLGLGLIGVAGLRRKF